MFVNGSSKLTLERIPSSATYRKFVDDDNGE